MFNKKKNQTETVATLPEHGPIDENGKEILLSLKNVDITFGKGDNAVKAVKNASFDIYKGETFSLVGESGSGKTTIGRAVIRVNPCANGEILYKGVRISGKIPRSLDREVRSRGLIVHLVVALDTRRSDYLEGIVLVLVDGKRAVVLDGRRHTGTHARQTHMIDG